MHNNIFYRNDGGVVDLIRDAEADWSTGSELIAGSNNWVAVGALHVPAQWAGTIAGTDPGFENFGSSDLRMAARLSTQPTHLPPEWPGTFYPTLCPCR